MTRTGCWRRRQRKVDAGFTLIEAIVSILIATIAFLALGGALLGAVAGSAAARNNQQAGDLLNRSLEEARALPYDSLAMRTTDMNAGESRTPTLTSCSCYSPTTDVAGGVAQEPLVLDAAGGLSPHVKTVAGTGALTYTASTYVTQPTDATGAVYKRVTVMVTWTSRGQLQKRKTSTLIAPTKRGLPLPDYKFTTSGPASQCRNPNSDVVYAFTLKNNGARDSWILTVALASPSLWTFYEDADGDLAYDPSVDPALPLNSAGQPVTGLLEPTQSRRILAVREILSTESVNVYTRVFTATSSAVPSSSQAQEVTTQVQTAPCLVTQSPSPIATATPSTSPSAIAVPPSQPGPPCGTFPTSGPGSTSGKGTIVRYSLHNAATAGSTNARLAMPFNKLLPSGSTMWNYSQDLSTSAGRQVNASNGASLAPADVAEWQYQVPALTKVKGTGLLTLFAVGVNNANLAAQTMSVTLELLSGGSTTTLALATVTMGPWTCSSFKQFDAALSFSSSGVSLPASSVIRLRVWMTGGSAMQLAYDTTSYPATLDLPASSGVG